MNSPHAQSAGQPSRAYAAAEWLLVLALMAIVAWTTLCLGGYLAQTMVVSGTAVLGLGVVGALLWAAGSGGEAGVLNRAVLLPLPFLLYALASVYWQAPAVWLAWREWLLWFQMWLVFALFLHFGRSRAHTWIIVSIVGGLAVCGVAMAAYQRFSDPHWLMLGRKQASQFGGRSSGMFGIPNSLAGLFELVLPACLSLLFSRAIKPGAKVISAWLAALFIFGLALTGSRGGWLALTLALLLWPLLVARSWQKKILGTVVVSGCVCAGLWALYHGSESARDRMEPFLTGHFEPSRPIVWKAGYQIWRDHPWVGTGTGSYNVMFEQYRPVAFRDEPHWTHNEYLNTLSDYGFAGFLLWAGAGAALLALAWVGITRARRAGVSSGDVFTLPKWKLGLLLGLLAYALHLCVDFHTKIPALAFLAAISLALLLRDEPGWRRPLSPLIAWPVGLAVALAASEIGWQVALPLYRAEALRFEARSTIDRYARTQQGDLGPIVLLARKNLNSAVRIDPKNGQAWADLAYATVQNWRNGGDVVALGRFAELAADEAIRCCSIDPEFWVRKGIALDSQRGRSEAEECFQQAIAIAPKSAPAWYAYAYYLQGFPERQDDAREAVETCLTLDPYYPRAEGLRQQLLPSR